MKKLILMLLTLTALSLSAVTTPGTIAVPSKIEREIKAAAATEWPDDFRMQKYTVDQQNDAYRKIEAWKKNTSGSVAKQITEKAVKEWPNDYRMQWYTIEQQVKAYNALNE